jgi:hypothetical protein
MTGALLAPHLAEMLVEQVIAQNFRLQASEEGSG